MNIRSHEKLTGEITPTVPLSLSCSAGPVETWESSQPRRKSRQRSSSDATRGVRSPGTADCLQVSVTLIIHMCRCRLPAPNECILVTGLRCDTQTHTLIHTCTLTLSNKDFVRLFFSPPQQFPVPLAHSTTQQRERERA